jgi:capsular polysaccharide biosynthesis protein
MKITELFKETINEIESDFFFHNIHNCVLKSIYLKNRKQAALYKYDIDDAYVSPYGAIFKNGRIIGKSIYKTSFKNTLKLLLSFYKKKIKRKVITIEDQCVVINHSWYQNYYHWMIEIVPRLYLIKDELSNKKLILNSNLSKFQIDTLEKFNFKEIVFINDDELARCKSITFTSFPNFYSNRFIQIEKKKIKLIELNLNNSIMNQMKDWFIANNSLIVNSLEIKNKKIYISRKKAAYRKILNEEILEKLLFKNEFVKVYLEELSFDQQVQLLNTTSIAVSIHGAGLTNILFMKQKTHIINLISENHHEFCYHTLASLCHVNYTHINCKGTNKKNPAYNDIIIDIETIKLTLNSIINLQ